MKIDCISDLHGHYPKLEGGDLLIIAGDLTANDTEMVYNEFFCWLRSQNYEDIIVIAGNHDNYLMNFKWPKDLEDAGEFTYLCDSGTEFEGLKIWGSPWTKSFVGMNPHCMAFTCATDEHLAEKWALIPDDIDILVTHSPPYGILDKVKIGWFKLSHPSVPVYEHVGSHSLALKVGKMETPPKLHVFGHIHESYGQEHKRWWKKPEDLPKEIATDIPKTIFINASHVNENYEPVNKPIRVIL